MKDLDINIFDDWSALKQTLHTSKNRVHFRQGEIWFVSIGQNIGYEVYGKGNKYLRPVIVFRKINRSTFLAMPLTSKIKKDRFHHEISFKDKQSSAILSQVRTIDAKRLVYKTGNLDRLTFENLEESFMEFYNLTSRKRGGYTHNSEQRVNGDIITKKSKKNNASFKVSIITSVYNNKETIEDAILSVLSQSYENVEYIVVDGGSTDGTLDIIEKYKDKIDTFISERDKGIYDGLNKGVVLATGDVVAFLHSDDLYASDTIIEEIVQEFNSTSVDGVYGDLIYTSKDDTSKILRYWKSKVFDSSLLKNGWMPAHPTLFLKKSVYNTYGSFDLSFKIAGDYDFMLRVLSAGVKVSYLPKVFYKMRVGGESNKSIKNIILKSKEDLRALNNNNVGGIFTLFIKNFSKVGQFLKKS